jgi:hypothetical protein
MSKSKVLIAATLALTGALGVGAAQAGNVDLQWSIMIGTPVYRQAVPVYVQPWPVYQPPARVWVQPAPSHSRRVEWRPTRWDRDGDGIPNRHDRLYNPRWDRDGDGIPNRHDRYPGRG